VNFSSLSRPRVWVLLIFITLVAALLRFYQLGAQSLWDGEIFTLLFAKYSWADLLPSVSVFSAHPPLWFVLSKIAVSLGWNETMLRAPAAFAGILSVPAMYVLGKRFFDTGVGLIGATLLALSPIDVIFSQNARNYSLFVLLVILLVYAAYRALSPSPFGKTVIARWRAERTTASSPSAHSISPLGDCFAKTARNDILRRSPSGGEIGWWFLFVFCALAGLYTHYLFVLPLVGTVLGIAITLMKNAARQAGGWKDVRHWWGRALVSARPFLIALIAIVAFYLPWTPTVGSAFLTRQLNREAGQDEDNAAFTAQDIPRLLKDFSGDATWGLVLLAALAVIGIVAAWRTQKRAALFWFGASLLLPIVVMVLLAPRRLPAKYLIYILPAYLLFAAQGIVAIAEFVAGCFGARERRAFAPAVALLILLVIAMLPNMPYWNGTQTIFTGKGWMVVDVWRPWRDAAASVTAHAVPGDFILFPDEARALTARSVTPYFSDAFLDRIYNAPPSGHAWWVSEAQDVPPENKQSAWQENYGEVVVQRIDRARPLQEIALPNASFEDGFKGWDKANNEAEYSLAQEQAVNGSSSARVTMHEPHSTRLHSTSFPVTPGKLYRVTAYIRAPIIGFYTVSPQLDVTFPGSKDNPRGLSRIPTLVHSDKPGWWLAVNDGIVPEDAKTARVDFILRDYARDLGATSWIDDVRVWLEP